MKDDFKEVKEFLRRYGVLCGELWTLIHEFNTWKERTEGIAAQLLDDMPRAPGFSKDSKVENHVIKVFDFEEMIAETAEKAQKALKEVTDIVEELPDPMGRLILLRYIEGLPWIEIQEEIGYQSTQTKRYHIKALTMISEKLDQNGRKRTEKD